MRQNRICSIIVALAMLMSVFASILVVNAEAASTVYTDVKDGVLTIGYNGFTDTALTATDVTVVLPEGVTATADSIDLTGTILDGADKNVSGNKVIISKAVKPAEAYQSGSEGILAKVTLTDADKAVSGSKYVVEYFAFTDTKYASYTLEDGDFVANEFEVIGTVSTPTPEPEPEGKFVYANGDVVSVDGTVTVTIGYKGFTDTALTATDLTVAIPEGFTATADSIDLTGTILDGADKNVSGNNIIISKAVKPAEAYQSGSEGILAKVTLKVNEDFTIPAEGVKIVISYFAFTDTKYVSEGLEEGVKTYSKPITADNGGSTPTPTPDVTPTPTPDVTPTPEPTPVTKFDNKVTSTTDSKLGMKMFSANIKIGEGENVNEVITDDDATYRIVFDAKKGTKTVGYGLVTVKGSALKTIIANGGDLGYNVSILGADTVKVHVEDSDGKAL